MPFDINERDATGQNILYVSALLGNKDLLDVILKFRVKAIRLCQSDVSIIKCTIMYLVYLNEYFLTHQNTLHLTKMISIFLSIIYNLGISKQQKC